MNAGSLRYGPGGPPAAYSFETFGDIPIQKPSGVWINESELYEDGILPGWFRRESTNDYVRCLIKAYDSPHEFESYSDGDYLTWLLPNHPADRVLRAIRDHVSTRVIFNFITS